MYPDIALGVEFGGLLNTPHGRDFRQNIVEEPRFVKQFEAAACPTLGEDTD